MIQVVLHPCSKTREFGVARVDVGYAHALHRTVYCILHACSTSAPIINIHDELTTMDYHQYSLYKENQCVLCMPSIPCAEFFPK